MGLSCTDMTEQDTGQSNAIQVEELEFSTNGSNTENEQENRPPRDIFDKFHDKYDKTELKTLQEVLVMRRALEATEKAFCSTDIQLGENESRGEYGPKVTFVGN